MFLEWMAKWEPVWLFIILFIETGVGCLTLYWVKREYDYDEAKDLKRQKRTKTSKKTITQPSGESTTEETTEVVESTDGPKGEGQ